MEFVLANNTDPYLGFNCKQKYLLRDFQSTKGHLWQVCVNFKNILKIQQFSRTKTMKINELDLVTFSL